MDMSTLFQHLDRIEKRESPLSSIASELRSDPRYVETDDDCPVDGCSGTIWKRHGLRLCERCSTIDGGAHARRTSATSLWTKFDDNRPQYRNSDEKRQVGGFPNYEWVSSDDIEGSIGDLDPSDFYDDA